jgi:hypothetical protein
MALGTVPNVLDISHTGSSGVAARRVHNFLDTIASVSGVSSAIFLGVNLRTVASHTAVLSYGATSLFVPNRLLVTATASTGIVGDAKITMGTTVGGDDILPEAAVTGLNAIHKTVIFLIIDDVPAIAGNATLHLSVTSADSGTVAVATVTLEGTLV